MLKDLCEIAKQSPRRETYIKADVSESPNDRNDRAIRIAAAWYMRRVPGMPIIMLTNDAENRRKALEMGINAMSVQVGTISPQSVSNQSS